MRKTLLLTAAPLFTALVVFGSLMSTSHLPSIDIVSIDKVYHAGAYFIMALLWYLWFYSRYLHKTGMVKSPLRDMLAAYIKPMAIAAAVLCFFVGLVLEFMQGYLTAHRSMDLYDIIANTTGIIIAVAVLFFLGRSKSQNTASKTFN